jgi:hypothetical protein
MRRSCEGSWLPESSPQQARITSSSGLKVVAYTDVGVASRDGAGCGKGAVVDTDFDLQT